MTRRQASGTEIRLRSGAYEARIVSVGAGIAGLTLKGADLVMPHAADELPDGYLGKTLMPWPNRIAKGTYTWEGTEYQVPVNETSTGAALHGLMAWVDWNIVHADNDSATLTSFIAPRYGYPWALEAAVTYALHAQRGLSVTLHATNITDQPAPYGVSSHPYLTLNNAPNANYELTIPARSILEVDAELTPVTLRSVSELDRDFQRGRLLGEQVVDHAFTDLPQEGWTVTLRDPSHTQFVSLSADTPWVQVFTADSLGRQSVAVEPMSCPPNAFNTHNDLIVLAPGQSHSMTFTICGDLG